MSPPYSCGNNGTSVAGEDCGYVIAIDQTEAAARGKKLREGDFVFQDHETGFVEIWIGCIGGFGSLRSQELSIDAVTVQIGAAVDRHGIFGHIENQKAAPVEA